MTAMQNIIDDFELIDDWEDRYRYLIELGQALEPLSDEQRVESNKVHGCVSQVWLNTEIDGNNTPEPILKFIGDSDAHIVRGLIAILLTLYSGKSASEILKTNANTTLKTLSLGEHLTPQRSNGLVAMVKRIQDDARAAQTQAHTG